MVFQASSCDDVIGIEFSSGLGTDRQPPSGKYFGGQYIPMDVIQPNVRNETDLASRA